MSASGAPPGTEKRNGRPLATGTRSNAQLSTSTTISLAHLVAEAQRLVAQISNQAAAADAAFRDAYRLGYTAGVEVGRQQLGNEILAEEARFSAHMSTITRMRAHADLEALRYPGYTREQLQKLRDWCPA